MPETKWSHSEISDHSGKYESIGIRKGVFTIIQQTFIDCSLRHRLILRERHTRLWFFAQNLVDKVPKNNYRIVYK